MTKMRKIDVLGVRFDNITIVDAVEQAMRLIPQHRGAYVVTPNPEIVLEARKNRGLSAAIKNADLVLPDGIGVIYASRILGTPINERVTGVDFAAALLARMSEKGMSLFLLGAKPGVAELAAKKIEKKYPGIRVVGTNDGYFAGEDAVVEKINAASPDFMMVCLGFPKQELFMQRNAERLDVGLMAGLGGVLDVYSGQVQLAPRRWRESGFEWLYRLIQEPKRIKRMIKLPGILLAALWRRLAGRG